MNRRDILKKIPFLAAIPFVRTFVRIPNEKQPAISAAVAKQMAESAKIYVGGRTFTRDDIAAKLEMKKSAVTFPPEGPHFTFPTGIRELHATPTGIYVQCEEGLYLICGGPDVSQRHSQYICAGRYEDMKLTFHNESPVGVESRGTAEMKKSLEKILEISKNPEVVAELEKSGHRIDVDAVYEAMYDVSGWKNNRSFVV